MEADRDEDMEAVRAAQGNIRAIIHALGEGAKNAGDLAISAAQRERDLATRKKRFLAKEERLRAAALDLMTTMEIDKEEWADLALSLAASPQKVIIADPDDLPDEYVTIETTRKPNMRLIKEHLDAGVIIDGATLSNGGTHLVLRTR